MIITVSGKGHSAYNQSQFSSDGFSVTMEPKDLGLPDPNSQESALEVLWKLQCFARWQILLMQARAGIITFQTAQYQYSQFINPQATPPDPSTP